MEELSIEEKAKAYDEAIERAKSKIKNDKDHVLYEDDIIDIFPALKENENERIRKALIRYFTLSDENAYNEACGVSYRDIVAWLKKQSTPQVRTGIEWVNTIDDACDKRYSEEYAHGEYCHEQSFKWGFQEGVDWLEEQSENNMGISEATKQELEDNLHKALEKETTESWNEFLDKQGEQKSIDDLTPQEAMDIAVAKCFEQGEKKSVYKVEPKFKIEEEKWYVCTHTYVLKGKIVVIKGQTYQAEKDNVIKGEDGCLFIDRHDGKALDYFRSWTIQDAKDGDVLVNWNNTIYLFKGIEEEVVKFYCYYNTNREEFNTPLDNNSHLGLTEPQFEHHPATKEQRNSLFQKIHEAGYTWDAEKKELKKEKVDNLHNYLYGEQNSAAWSKEDDYVIERLFCLLHNEQDKYPQQSSEFQELEEIGNKLISFKDRVQSKQEWSEEDKKILNSLISSLARIGASTRTDSTSINYTFSKEIDWLKSLRPKNTWKPSEEEMVALEHAINCYSSISPTNTNEVFILEIMKERLKNLMK